jgi:hypothetical protein
MNEHTKEPWELWESGDASPHQIFTRAELDQIEIHHYGFTDPDGSIAAEQLANARRIVACVNACRGLPTKELEEKGLVSAVGSELLERDQQLATLTARLSESEQRELEAVSIVAALPKTALDIRAFIGSYFNSLKYGRPDEVSCDEDVYVVSVHDLLSAFSELLEFHPQAIPSLRQQHMEEAAKACDAIQRKHEDAAKREDDVEERAFREGEACGAEDCGEAIRRLAQGEGNTASAGDHVEDSLNMVSAGRKEG